MKFNLLYIHVMDTYIRMYILLHFTHTHMHTYIWEYVPAFICYDYIELFVINIYIENVHMSSFKH